MINLYDHLTARLRASGDYLWPLVLRLIMFWEFWESGMEKLKGNNWFASIQDDFPYPFNQLSADLNWLAAQYGELVFSVMLALGLFTRFAAFSLIIITVVAASAVHWPAEWASLAELWKGYAISDKGFGNYKLPLLFVVALLPLVFYGGGKISLDRLLLKLTGRESYTQDSIGDAYATAWMFIILGFTTIFVEPYWGITFFALGAASMILPMFRH
jgi:putative oxidoreductase